MASWQGTPYFLPLIVASTFAFALALFSWRHRSVTGAIPFTIMMLAVSFWCLGYAIQLESNTLIVKLIISNLCYTAIVIVPVAWFIFTLQYTGQDRWITQQNILLLAIIPVLTLIVMWTDNWHHLFRSQAVLDASGLFTVMDVTHGPLFWTFTAYSYTLLLAGALVIIRSILNSPGIYRSQAIVTLIGMLVPALSNFISIFNISEAIFPHLDLTPFAFTITGIVMSWGVFRYRLLDVVPVARDTLVESMPDAIVVLDARNRIVDINPAAEELVAQPAAKVIGERARHVLSTWPNLIDEYRYVLNAQAEVTLEINEERKHFDLQISPLRNFSGRLTGRLVVLRDITSLKQAQEAAEQANRVKSEFVSIVSHELRAPINAILGSAELLTNGYAGTLTPKQKRFADIIESTARRMTTLVVDLTDISRIESGNMRLIFDHVSVHEVATEIAAAMRSQLEKQHQTLSLEITNDLPAVWCDRNRLSQIITNLVSNAQKFTPEGGHIRIHASQDLEDTGLVQISVADNGVGIASEDQEKIFQKFFRSENEHVRHVPGTGLGLSITKNLVEMQDGRIWFESTFRKGTTFYFTVPISKPEPPKDH